MSFASWNGTITNALGRPVDGARVTVEDEDGGLPVLYSNRAGSVNAGNPVFSDSKGQVLFYAAAGSYRITVEFDGETATRRHVAIGTTAETDIDTDASLVADSPEKVAPQSTLKDIIDSLQAQISALSVSSGVRQTVAITGADTITASHLRAAVSVSGYFTLALTAAATLGDKFWFSVTNQGTRRVIINPNGAELINGVATIELWPGMSCDIFCTGTAFYTVGLQSRWRYTADTSIFVDTTNGNDANDGLAAGSGNARKTIMSAYVFLNGKVDHGDTPFISSVTCAAGTYNEQVLTSGPIVGALYWNLIGDITTPANCIINVGNNEKCLYVKNYSVVKLSGFRLQGGTGAFGITAEQYGHCDYTKIEWGTMLSGRHRSTNTNGSLEAVGTSEIVGNAGFHTANQRGGYDDLAGQIVTIATARAFATAFAYADYMGLITNNGGSYAGAGVAGTTGKRYEGHRNAVINSNGGGANFFPGNVAGTVATQALYA